MLYKERTPKTNLRGSQSGGYLSPRSVVPLIGKSGLRLEGHMLRSYSLLTPQRSTIGDAVSLPCALSLLPSPLSAPLSPASARSALSLARRRRAHRRPPRASDAFFSTQRPPLTHDYIKSMVSLSIRCSLRSRSLSIYRAFLIRCSLLSRLFYVLRTIE